MAKIEKKIINGNEPPPQIICTLFVQHVIIRERCINLEMIVHNIRIYIRQLLQGVEVSNEEDERFSLGEDVLGDGKTQRGSLLYTCTPTQLVYDNQTPESSRQNVMELRYRLWVEHIAVILRKYQCSVSTISPVQSIDHVTTHLSRDYTLIT